MSAHGELSELELAQLLCTRLCHDLAGPIGAVTNGAELLQSDPSFAAEAGDLLVNSAKTAAVRLKCLRIAFGLVGERTPEIGGLASFLRDYFAAVTPKGAGIVLEWNVDEQASAGLEAMLLNMCLLAAEALPRGGALSVGGEGGDIVLLAVGQGAKLRDDLIRAAAQETDGLTARSVQAYLTARLAAQAAHTFVVESQGDGEVILSASPE